MLNQKVTVKRQENTINLDQRHIWFTKTYVWKYFKNIHGQHES